MFSSLEDSQIDTSDNFVVASLTEEKSFYLICQEKSRFLPDYVNSFLAAIRANKISDAVELWSRQSIYKYFNWKNAIESTGTSVFTEDNIRSFLSIILTKRIKPIALHLFREEKYIVGTDVEKRCAIKKVLSSHIGSLIKTLTESTSPQSQSWLDWYIKYGSEEKIKAAIEDILSCCCAFAMKLTLIPVRPEFNFSSPIEWYIASAGDVSEKKTRIKKVFSSECPEVIQKMISLIVTAQSGQVYNLLEWYFFSCNSDAEKASAINNILHSHCNKPIAKLSESIIVTQANQERSALEWYINRHETICEKVNSIDEILKACASSAIKKMAYIKVSSSELKAIDWYIAMASSRDERINRIHRILSTKCAYAINRLTAFHSLTESENIQSLPRWYIEDAVDPILKADRIKDILGCKVIKFIRNLLKIPCSANQNALEWFLFSSPLPKAERINLVIRASLDTSIKIDLIVKAIQADPYIKKEITYPSRFEPVERGVMEQLWDAKNNPNINSTDSNRQSIKRPHPDIESPKSSAVTPMSPNSSQDIYGIEFSDPLFPWNLNCNGPTPLLSIPPDLAELELTPWSPNYKGSLPLFSLPRDLVELELRSQDEPDMQPDKKLMKSL